MKKRNRIIALALVIAMIIGLLVGVIGSFAKEPMRDVTGLELGQTSVLYDSSIGLPTSEANAVVQSKDGFIWIGSYSGLVRYDGNEFYRYDSSQGISSVVSLYVDSKDRLWIGTNDGGAAVKVGEEFQFFSKSDGLRSASVRSIAEDDRGNIYLATTQGLYYIDPDMQLHDMPDGSLHDDFVYEIKNDSEGIIYGVTTDGHFFYVKDNAMVECYDDTPLGIGNVTCIEPDPDRVGFVYLGTEGNTIIYGDITVGMATHSTYTTGELSYIKALRQAEGMLWVCSDSGIGYVDSRGLCKKLEKVDINNSVDDMMVDYEGNYWFASSRQGVMKITKSIFTDISRSAALPGMVVNTTCMFDDLLYLGTDTGLVIVRNETDTVENELTDMLKGIRIRSIKKDSKGNILLSTYSEYGLVCYSQDGTITCYDSKTGMNATKVRTSCELSDGSIAVSTNEGIYFVKDGKTIDKLDYSDGIINTEILTICQTDDGSILMGSDGGGLYLYKENEIKHYGMEDGLESEVILRVKKDSQREGIYWIITSNSIAYYKDGVITSIKNYPYSNNFDLFEGRMGDLWVLSSAGIYRVDAQQMLDNEEIDYTIFNSENGLPYVTTANSRNYMDEDGTVYISGTNGVCSFNVTKYSIGEDQVKLTVPYVEVDGEHYEVKYDESGKGKVTIPSSAKRVIVNGYALTFSLNNPAISYQLEGFDEEPTRVTRRELGPVNYTNLSGGKYTYHLATIDPITEDVWSELYITIIKKKAFWEHIWFYVVMLVVLAIIAYFIIKNYIKRRTEALERKQKETQKTLNSVVRAFAKAIDFKDRYTNGHSFRVAKYTKLLAKKLGYSDDEIQRIYNIALLHDIGKITIPDEILNKPEALNDEEYKIMKEHTSKGYEILKEIDIDPDLALGAGYHHEHLDGKGYPQGLSGDDIPMVAQLIAVADTFDAMYSTRPYRKKMPLEEVISEIRRVGGTQLNKEVVESLVELAQEGALGADKVK